MHARSRIAPWLVTMLAIPWLASGRPAQASTPVTVGADLAFIKPQASADGLVVTLERHHSRGILCPGGCPPPFTDIMVLDLRDCAHEVLRPITRDGVSRGSAISADGELIAWSSGDASSGFQIFRGDSGGFWRAADFDSVALEVQQVDMSSSGAHVVYWRQTSTTEQIVMLGALDPLVVDSGTGLRLADEHVVTDSGTVYYTKPVAGVTRVFSACPPPPGGLSCDPPVQLTSDPATSERFVTVSRDGSVVAFVQSRQVGTQNIQNIVVLVSGTTVQLTSNSDPTVQFTAAAVTPEGEFVTFGSNGDLEAGRNPNRDWQVFRVDLAGVVRQVSSYPGNVPPGPGGFLGVTSDDAARTFYQARTTCPAGICMTPHQLHQTKIHFDALDPATPLLLPKELTPTPPFDVSEVDPIATPACSFSIPARSISCEATIRNSGERVSQLVYYTEWEVIEPAGSASLTRRRVQPMTLQPNQRGLLVDDFSVPIPAGTPGLVAFRVHAIGPAAVQADGAWGEWYVDIP